LRDGIHICSVRDKIRKILINLQKSSSHEPLARNALIVGMNRPLGEGIQVCSNEVHWVKKLEKSFFP